MTLLQVHHMAGVRDDDVPLISVWELLEEGEEAVKVSDIVIFAVNNHRGNRHEPGIKHRHYGNHVKLGAGCRLLLDLRGSPGIGIYYFRIISLSRGHGIEAGLPACLGNTDVGVFAKDIDSRPSLGEVRTVQMHLGVADVLFNLLGIGHDKHPAVLRPPRPSEKIHLLYSPQLPDVIDHSIQIIARLFCCHVAVGMGRAAEAPCIQSENVEAFLRKEIHEAVGRLACNLQVEALFAGCGRAVG